jgi:hypothetical protein
MLMRSCRRCRGLCKLQTDLGGGGQGGRGFAGRSARIYRATINVHIPLLFNSSATMRLNILLHPQLRTNLSECAQRGLRRSVWVRFKSQIPRPSQKHLSPLPKKETAPAPPVRRTVTPTTGTSASPKISTRSGMGRFSTLRVRLLINSCRATGTDIGILWRHRQSYFPRYSAYYDSASLRCSLSDCCTSMRCGRLSMV